jgi:hypothetical protein
VCPKNLTSVTFHAWGAGGGCSYQGGVVGGAGAYVTGTLAVTPGTTYYIVIGCGGFKSDDNYYKTPYTYGGGGYSYGAGSGGGYSGIFTEPFPSQASALLVVGGGGGAGPSSGNEVGGSASWTSNAQSGGTDYGVPGGGATSSGPGTSGGGASTDGSALQGGNGGRFGGGGGGGYWGGGGGGFASTGGGGGNSYWNSSYVSSVSGADALSQPNMTYLPAPGSDNQYYQAFAGSSYNWQNGGNGLLVLVESPSTHPFVSIPPQVTLSLSPLNFNKCVLWIDASQLTTLNGILHNFAPQSSYGVQCSGTLNHKGKNRLNTILISRFQYMTTVPAPYLQAYTLFFVGRQTGGQNNRVLNGYGNFNQLYGYWGGYKKALFLSGNPGYLTGYYADTEWDLLSHSRTANGPFVLHWNGDLLFSNNRSSTTNSLYGFTINAGDYNDTSGNGQGENSDCEIAEIILYDSVLTPLQVKQVEGYLAQKWAIDLPASHPYKSIPPPKSINPALVYSDYLLTTVYSLAAQVPDRSGPYNAGGNNIGWGSIIQSATANRYIHYGNNNNVYISGHGNYSCFTSGYVYSLLDTVINFRVVSDDGIIVNFNGANVIDQFKGQAATQYDSGTLQISAGYTPIRITWYDTGGGGQYDLYYSYDQSNFTDDLLGRFYHLSTATY